MLPFLLYGRATGHPLQSLADAITMEEFKTDHRPKVVLSWAPHPKALTKLSPIPLCKWCNCKTDFVITHPKVTNSTEITKDSKIEYDQNKAFENADLH
jgi:N-succinyl-L-ornithine transcarbamylase